MVVLVPGQRQATALDGVADETDRLIGIDTLEGLQHAFQAMAAEIGHGGDQLVVIHRGDQVAAGGIGEIGQQLLAPGVTTLEGQSGKQVVVAFIEPVEDRFAAGTMAQGLQLLAVFHGDDAPAHILEGRDQLVGERGGDHRIQALAVIVDDPPGIAEVMLPAFDQGLIDIALVELGIAGQRHHAAGRPGVLTARPAPVMGMDVVLHQAGERGHGDAEPDRAGGEIDVIGILGTRGIGLRPAQSPEAFQLVEILVAEQVLDGMEDRRGMRFHGDPVFRP